MPPERFVDAMPLLLMTTASLRADAALHPAGEWDVRRFRPNVLLDASGDGWLEDDWCGRVLRIGDVAGPAPAVHSLHDGHATPARPQPRPRRLPHLVRHHGGTLGVWTAVLNGGTIAETDVAQLVADSHPDH
jgi:uncharacterized protein YcbX